MKRMKELYQELANAQMGSGVVAPELLEELKTAEMEYLRNELASPLEDMSESLRNIQRPMLLLVKYFPDRSLSVQVTSEIDQNSMLKLNGAVSLDEEKEEVTEVRGQENKKSKRESNLIIRFPDGTVFDDPKAAKAFAQAIEKIGLERVYKLADKEPKKFVFSKMPLTIPPYYEFRRDQYGPTSFQNMNEGWKVFTHFGNDQKKRILDRISDYLDLKLEVTFVPKPRGGQQ